MTLDMRLRNPRRAHKWHVEVECQKCAMMPFGGTIVGCKEEQRIFRWENSIPPTDAVDKGVGVPGSSARPNRRAEERGR